MKYLLDSNVFIEAKNKYYAFDLAPPFWAWLDDLCCGSVGTISKVYDELTDYEDELAKWMKDRRGAAWILAVSDSATQSAYRKIADHVNSKPYKDSGKRQFLDKADGWLIAKAQVLGASIVTHEVSMPEAVRKVPLFDVAAVHGIGCVNTFDFLRHHGKKFS